jgi:predicted permease
MVGRTLVMNDRQYTVIGVMPRSFVFRQNDIDFWVPIRFTPAQAASRNSHYLTVVARLKPGVTLEAARADMLHVSTVLQQEHPETNGELRTAAVVLPLKNDLLGDTRLELFVLMGAAAAVLLIACANLMSLLLSRAIGRRSELAVRVALGATRPQLIRQMLIEATVLAMGGGLAALVIAPAGISLLAQLIPDGFPPSPASVLNARLLLFTFVLAILAAAVFSLIPAWQATRASTGNGRLHPTRSVVGHESGRMRDGLVVVQLAAALVLLFAAGVMLRTVANVRSIDLGFRPERLLTLRTPLPRARYADPAPRLRFYAEVISGVRALPGVEQAAYASTLPFTSIGNTNGYQIEGVTIDSADPGDALWRVGTPEYLQTLGATAVDGRLLDHRDASGAPLAVVINQTMARKYWPHESALGHRLRFRPQGAFYTIVGVVRDIRERGYTLDMKPAVYLTVAQADGAATDTLVVRVRGDDPLAIAGAVRRVVSSVDPDEPAAAIRTMDDILARNIRDRRQQTLLLSAFGGLALLLAVLGLYGVASYSVAQRTREFGVRLALGASTGSVIRTVIVRGLLLTAIGLGAGFTVAWAVSHIMASLLYGVTSTDPATFAAVVAILCATGIAASYVPARRATRIELTDVLRQQ